MGFTYESRFKKKFNLEKNWMMNTNDIAEITGLDPEHLKELYLKSLKETKSRTQAINHVCGYCLKELFPKESSNEDTNVPH
jgi:hypothetical protein